MRGFLSSALGVVGMLGLAGCGGIELPDDHLTVIVNGDRTTVALEGDISVQIDGVPELTYSGPAGCAGHYFADGEGDIYFRYTPKRAFLLRGNQLYTFATPPREAGDGIAWRHTFGADEVTVLANCPLP